MKIIKQEKINTESLAKDMYRYYYDKLESPADVELFLRDMVENGYSIDEGIYVDYETDHALMKVPTSFKDLEEFQRSLDSIDWPSVNWISVSGHHNGECYDGNIIPQKNGGVFILVTPKKKEEPDAIELQQTPYQK